jgi:A/G-specific adenine glycosylase
MEQDFENIQLQLMRWFERVGRDLPWRKDYHPYHVWISEIMLQQTQMERGVTFFYRWIEELPDIGSVAAASEEKIMKLWEGLGYYARARNLHKAAKEMVKKYSGELPQEHSTLLTLPGIGPYTASAIASIAFNQDYPVVDANVERVFSRLFDIDTPLKEKDSQKRIEALALQLLPTGKSRQFNQALMEFGGILCTPKKPQCPRCPIAKQCLSLLRGVVNERPIPVKGKQIIPIEMVTGVLVSSQRVFIQKRLAHDIWGGLWEFPGGRVEEGETLEEAVAREYLEETEFQVEVCEKITTVIHHYTRYKVILHCYICKLLSSKKAVLHAAQEAKWIAVEELQDFGFPAGHRKLLSYIEKNCPEIFHSNIDVDLEGGAN